MKISKKCKDIADSVTMAITARAKTLKTQGIDVISFGAGEPDFDTPDFIKEACKNALDNGATKYTPAAGIPELRQEIALKLKGENNLNYDPTQIIVTNGAKLAIFHAINAIVDQDDEVLFQAPYWVSYPEMVKLAGAKSKIINTDSSTNYKLTSEILKQNITDKTKILILNSPNNPGGFCYTKEELINLGKVLSNTDITIISDEIYEYLVYENTKFTSFAEANPNLIDQIITVNGLSKAYSMTGWRIGYLAAPKEMVSVISKMQSHMTSGTVTFCQIASKEAIRHGKNEIEKMRVQFEKRANRIFELLNEIEDVSCIKPTGAFYVFPDVSKLYSKLGVTGSVEFCQKLLEQAKVACVPGLAFGCDKNIRLSFATSLEQIEEGLKRIKNFVL